MPPKSALLTAQSPFTPRHPTTRRARYLYANLKRSNRQYTTPHRRSTPVQRRRCQRQKGGYGSRKGIRSGRASRHTRRVVRRESIHPPLSVRPAPSARTVSTARNTALYLDSPNDTHFWHFMMGELLPTIAAYLRQPTPRPHTIIHLHKSVNALACPFNTFYTELETPRLRFVLSETKVLGASYEMLPTNRNGWDWRHTRQDVPHILAAARYLRSWALSPKSRTSTNVRALNRRSVRVVVQKRVNQQELTQYYANLNTPLFRQPKRKQYGAERRCVTNLDAVVRSLRSSFSSESRVTVDVATDDGKTLREQIRQYAEADVLVLGHGAGMIHALWMRAPVTIVEIINRQKEAIKDGAVQGCKRLVSILSTQGPRAHLHRIHVGRHTPYAGASVDRTPQAYARWVLDTDHSLSVTASATS